MKNINMIKTILITLFFVITFKNNFSQVYTEIEWFNPPKYAKFKQGNHKGVTHIYKISQNSLYEFSLERYNDKYSFKNPSPQSDDPKKFMWPIQVLDEDGIYRWVQGRLLLVGINGEPVYIFEIAKRTIEEYKTRGKTRIRTYNFQEREYLNVVPMPGFFMQIFSELKEDYIQGKYGNIVIVAIILFFILYKITMFIIHKVKSE